MVSPWFRFHNKRLRQVQELGRKTVLRYQWISCTREEYRQLQGDPSAKTEAMQDVIEWMQSPENSEIVEVCARVTGGGSTLFTVRRIDGEFFEFVPGQKLKPIPKKEAIRISE